MIFYYLCICINWGAPQYLCPFVFALYFISCIWLYLLHHSIHFINYLCVITIVYKVFSPIMSFINHVAYWHCLHYSYSHYPILHPFSTLSSLFHAFCTLSSNLERRRVPWQLFFLLSLSQVLTSYFFIILFICFHHYFFYDHQHSTYTFLIIYARYVTSFF